MDPGTMGRNFMKFWITPALEFSSQFLAQPQLGWKKVPLYYLDVVFWIPRVKFPNITIKIQDTQESILDKSYQNILSPNSWIWNQKKRFSHLTLSIISHLVYSEKL